MNPQVLIGPSLGMIPDVGPFLSGVYGGVEGGAFNATLLSTLNDIENKLADIDSYLQSLGAQIAKNAINAETLQAKSQIDTWYTSQAVTNWMEGSSITPISTTTGTTGNLIQSDCNEYLNLIHSAIMQKNGEPVAWLQTQINALLAASSSNQTVSYVETTYQYFLKLVHLQMKGVACLRATGGPNLTEVTLKVANNIIAQGGFCQKIAALRSSRYSHRLHRG